MAAETATRIGPRTLDHLSVEDFETASIRSAAPSYVSEAPSYHSTIPPSESIPPYSPRTAPSYNTSSAIAAASTTPRSSSVSINPGAGLPRIPSPARREDPQLSAFRIPTWSTTHQNPTARHYHSVASRRANRAGSSSGNAQIENTLRTVLTRVEEQENSRVRPLEDPYLVGEVAAARAKRERLARENGEDALILDARRWDWWLAQTRDWDERQRSWTKFRQEVETGHRTKLARRLGRFI